MLPLLRRSAAADGAFPASALRPCGGSGRARLAPEATASKLPCFEIVSFSQCLIGGYAGRSSHVLHCLSLVCAEWELLVGASQAMGHTIYTANCAEN